VIQTTFLSISYRVLILFSKYTPYIYNMEYVALFIFFSVTSCIALFMSSFPYKLQSVMLGIAGAVSGGMLAYLLNVGFTTRVSEMLLITAGFELLLLFFLRKTLRLN
jgi:uncharacterized membrane protein YeaQ/YmgE (transglycosylase-associated protein family)